jgi:membrane protease YdiL (CAAX protease family)
MTDNSENNKKPALPTWARIVLVIFAYIILTGVFQFVGMRIINIPVHDQHAFQNITLSQQVIIGAIGLIPLIFIIYVLRTFVDKQSISSMGFSVKNRFGDISAGFITALTIIVGGSLILYALKYIDFISLRFDLYSILLSLVLFIIVAFNEEILMRGYILNNLMTAMNKYWALIISASIFSILHALNPNISVLALINIVLAGIILGSTYIFTKNIWFPISLHLFWNFFQGPILGYPVSGMKIVSVFKIKMVGNNFINGGQFGFEGSIVCTVLLVLAIVMILVYYIKLSHKMKFFSQHK